MGNNDIVDCLISLIADLEKKYEIIDLVYSWFTSILPSCLCTSSMVYATYHKSSYES